jgi:predicted NBD/HSP70 family sugar kinase
LTAVLRGSKEVPVAGGATGTASIRLNQGQKRVCFTITLSGLGGSPVVAGHIHQGAAGVAGGVFLPLPNDSLAALDRGAPAKGCIQNVDVAKIKAIRQNPAGFYVNVHTAQFPAGAARGQLAK